MRAIPPLVLVKQYADHPPTSCSRLPILGDVPRHSMPPSRAAESRANLGCGGEQVPREPGLLVQGDGLVHGNDDLRMGQDGWSSPAFRLRTALTSLDDAIQIASNCLQGPALFYVDSDGAYRLRNRRTYRADPLHFAGSRLKGDLFSVGSGSTFAYGVYVLAPRARRSRTSADHASFTGSTRVRRSNRLNRLLPSSD